MSDEKPYQEVPPGFIRLEHYNATIAEMNRQREQVTKQADAEIERLKAELAIAPTLCSHQNGCSQDVSGVDFDRLKTACEYFVGSLVADNRQNAAKEYRNIVAELGFDPTLAANKAFEDLLDSKSLPSDAAIERADRLQSRLDTATRLHNEAQANALASIFEAMKQRDDVLREANKIGAELRRLADNLDPPNPNATASANWESVGVIPWKEGLEP
jgi:hypothetical protein